MLSDIFNREQTAIEIQRFGARCYVYHLIGPDNLPFYVGKGRGSRVFDHERERLEPGLSEKWDLIQSALTSGSGLRYRLIGPLKSETEAFSLEAEQILFWKRRDQGGVLTNQSDGGPGTTATRIGSPDAYGQRGVGNRYLLQWIDVKSIPIKPVLMYEPMASSKARIRRGLTRRQAGALLASAIANGDSITDGPCRIKRRMVIDGIPFIIEDGATKSILENRAATLISGTSREDQAFQLDTAQARALCAMVESEPRFKAALDAQKALGGAKRSS